MGMGEGVRLGAPVGSRFLPKHTHDPGRDPWACSDLTTNWEEDVWGRGGWGRWPLYPSFNSLEPCMARCHLLRVPTPQKATHVGYEEE